MTWLLFFLGICFFVCTSPIHAYTDPSSLQQQSSDHLVQITTGSIISGHRLHPLSGVLLAKNYTGFFIIDSTTPLKRLSTIYRSIMVQRTFAYQETIVSLINWLKESNILKQKDIQHLRKKFHFRYVSGCENIWWKISIQQRYKDGSRVRNELDRIDFPINMCFTKAFSSHFYEYTQHTIVHELWHRLYYFRDIEPYTFQTICREKWMRKKTCTKDAFFSEYAMQNQEEDYAESFAAWYLQIFPVTENSALLAKKAYFDTLRRHLTKE